MKSPVVTLTLVLLVSTASSGFAQATRTWVSGVGDDVNPCSRTAPCKTFAGALPKTASGGEISVLDAGGFGSVTITKSITINGSATHASILGADQANGVIVSGAGIVVNLRNLSIIGGSSAAGAGIKIVDAAAVNIENVTISERVGAGDVARGISVETSGANTRVSITNSYIANIKNSGIYVRPTSGSVVMEVDRTQVSRSGEGIAIMGNVTASISNSTVSGNSSDRSGAGVNVDGAAAVVNISNCVIANNRFGITNGATGASVTRLFGSVITGNTEHGLRIDAGSVVSYGNNGIRGNGGNEKPSQTIGMQ